MPWTKRVMLRELCRIDIAIRVHRIDLIGWKSSPREWRRVIRLEFILGLAVPQAMLG
jgi:hypothetical protein